MGVFQKVRQAILGWASGNISGVERDPLHRFWPIFGQLTLLVTAVLFAQTVQWGGLALSSWWLEKDFEKASRKAIHVAPDESQKRSGRGRPREYSRQVN
jgi:hypothetical protein